MKNRIIVIITGILLITLNSCIKSLLCVHGDGIINTEIHRVTAFDQIENATSFDIIYKHADTFGITIRAEQNIMNYIETNVYDGCLEIRTSPGTICLDYTEQPVITVTSPGLQSVKIAGSGAFIAEAMSGETVLLKLTGSGNLSVEEVACNDLNIIVTGSGNIGVGNSTCLNSDVLITGSGDVSVSGDCENSHLRITGSGNIYSGNLMSITASVIISGSGNAFTNIQDSLNGLITGSGNIYVKGDPVIEQTITGSGRIIKHK